MRNEKQKKADLDQKADCCDQKGQLCFTKTVDDTGKGRRKVEKRTEPGKDINVHAGTFIVKKKNAKFLSEQKKDAGKQITDKKAVFSRQCNICLDFFCIFSGISLSNRGQKHNGKGIGDRRGEKDKWQCNSGEDAIDAKGILRTAAIFF